MDSLKGDQVPLQYVQSLKDYSIQKEKEKEEKKNLLK